jgi:hypothetical protein
MLIHYSPSAIGAQIKMSRCTIIFFEYVETLRISQIVIKDIGKPFPFFKAETTVAAHNRFSDEVQLSTALVRSPSQYHFFSRSTMRKIAGTHDFSPCGFTHCRQIFADKFVYFIRGLCSI